MFLPGFASAPRWDLACPWVSGCAARFALGLKNYSTPLNCDNRVYSIQCLSAKRGWNTFREGGTGQPNCGEFSCFRLGGRNGFDGNDGISLGIPGRAISAASRQLHMRDADGLLGYPARSALP